MARDQESSHGPGAVAWVVALVAVPVLAVPLYWVFGRNRFAGYRDAIRVVEQKHKDSVETARRAMYGDNAAGDLEIETPLVGLANILRAPVSHGNHFELLIDGGPYFESLLQQITSAERYIYAQLPLEAVCVLGTSESARCWRGYSARCRPLRR